MKYKTVTCGKCLCSVVAHSDIHNKAWTCPTCGQVQGILWSQFDGEKDVSNRVPSHLDGEGEYDWDWLEYDKPKRAGDDA